MRKKSDAQIRREATFRLRHSIRAGTAVLWIVKDHAGREHRTETLWRGSLTVGHVEPAESPSGFEYWKDYYYRVFPLYICRCCGLRFPASKVASWYAHGSREDWTPAMREFREEISFGLGRASLEICFSCANTLRAMDRRLSDVGQIIKRLEQEATDGCKRNGQGHTRPAEINAIEPRRSSEQTDHTA